jgi:hypothetical protein
MALHLLNDCSRARELLLQKRTPESSDIAAALANTLANVANIKAQCGHGVDDVVDTVERALLLLHELGDIADTRSLRVKFLYCKGKSFLRHHRFVEAAAVLAEAWRAYESLLAGC